MRMRTHLGLLAGHVAPMQIPFAAVNPDSVPPRLFPGNRLETHIKKPFLSVKLVHENRTQTLVSLMSDSLGPIFIICNVCSLSLGTKKNAANINIKNKTTKKPHLVSSGVNLLKNSNTYV